MTTMKALSKTTILLLAAVLVTSSSAHADWSIPVTITAGSSSTVITMGVSEAATNGYDKEYDVPAPGDAEGLDAYFPHADWSVTVGGKAIRYFHEDKRGALPQDWYFEAKTPAAASVTMTWDLNELPASVVLALRDNVRGTVTDMRTGTSYSCTVTGTQGFTIHAEQGDITAPAPPADLSTSDKDGILHVTWTASPEPDLAGYKIRIGAAPGTYYRVVDIRNVENYNFFNLLPGATYHIALSAYDRTGNESELSREVTGSIALPAGPPEPAAPPVATGVSPSSATNGAPVVIAVAGTGFTAASTVKLGSATLSNVRLADAATLVATVPAGLAPGSYDITVTNADGTSATLAKAYTATQQTYAVAGTLRGRFGGAQPNVRLVVAGNGIKRTVTTDRRGMFSLADLAPGAYTIKPLSVLVRIDTSSFTITGSDVTLAIKRK